MEQLCDEGIAVASSAGHPMPEGYKDDVEALRISSQRRSARGGHPFCNAHARSENA
jgi:hypothetical protein